jgi:hypothetical protein
MSESIYTTTSRAMDSVELATGTFSGWLLQSIRSGLGLVDETFQPVAAAPAKPSDPRDREEEEKERRARSR